MSQTEVTIWQEIAEVKDAVSQVLAHAKQLGAST
jgi:PmbA protein